MRAGGSDSGATGVRLGKVWPVQGAQARGVEAFESIEPAAGAPKKWPSLASISMRQSAPTMRVLTVEVGATAREIHRSVASFKRAGRVRSVGQRSLTRYLLMIAER